MYFLTANVIMLLAYLSRRALFSFLFPPRFVFSVSLSLMYFFFVCVFCFFFPEHNFVYLQPYLFVSVRFLMSKSNMFLANGRDHPSLREIMRVICL